MRLGGISSLAFLVWLPVVDFSPFCLRVYSEFNMGDRAEASSAQSTLCPIYFRDDPVLFFVHLESEFKIT